jgi:hypothetical protein
VGIGIQNQNLSSPDSTKWAFGSGDFTIEMFVKPDPTSNSDLVSTHVPGVSSGWRLILGGNTIQWKQSSGDILVLS